MSDLIGIGVVMIGIAAVLWVVGELIGTVLRERARCKTIDAISGIVKELGAALKLVLGRGHERSHAPSPDVWERETSEEAKAVEAAQKMYAKEAAKCDAADEIAKAKDEGEK